MFEEYTEEYFMDQAKAMGQELGVDTRQGSVYMDAAAGHCLRAAKFYSDLRIAFEMLSVDTCGGDILDEKAKERQIFRKKATPAYYEVQFTGVEAARMAGDRFMAGGLYFTLSSYENGFYLQAEVPGTKGNALLPDQTVIPVKNTVGLKSAVLGDLFEAGTDQESDESLRERYKAVVSGPVENGNRQQYKTWCESYEGIGRAIITPLAYGPNTAKGLLISANGTSPSEALIREIQEDIDPGSQGLGKGKAFIGCKFYVEAARETPVNLSFHAELSAGYTAESALAAAKKDVKDYLRGIALDPRNEEVMVVQYVKIVGILADTPGIKDFTDLTVNDGTGNVTIESDCVAVLGEVRMDVGIL